MGIPQSIYVVETLPNKIKIGITSNVETRFRTIECQSGDKITNSFHTDKCNDAYKIEHSLHRTFKEYRSVGEWFDINFSDAVNCVKIYDLDLSIEDPEVSQRLSELPVHIAGWAIIMAFTREPNQYTYSHLVDSIEVALDLFYKYSGASDSRYTEDPLLQFELMRVMDDMRVKRILEKAKRIGI